MQGFFLFDFFEAAFNALVKVVKAVVNIIKKVVSFVSQAVYKAIRLIGKVSAFVWEGAIDIITLGPLRRWSLTRGLIAGLDYITGGLLTSVRSTLMLPAKLMRGEKITRAELMDALSFAAKVAMVVVTGGATLAVIGASTSFLKDGPLGKTALGRTLLDVASVVSGAALTGANIVTSLVSKGQEVLKGEALSFVADKSGLSKTVLGNTVFTAAAGAVTGQTTEEIVKSSAIAAAGGGEVAKLLVGAGAATVSAESGSELQALMSYTEGVAREKASPVLSIAEILEDPSKLETYERQVSEATSKVIETTAKTLSVASAADAAGAQAAKDFDAPESGVLYSAVKTPSAGVPAVQVKDVAPEPSKYLDQGMTDIASSMKNPSLANLNLPKPELSLDEIVKFAMRFLMPGKTFKDLTVAEQEMIRREIAGAYPGYAIPDFNFEFDLEGARLKREARGKMLIVAAGAVAAFIVFKD